MPFPYLIFTSLSAGKRERIKALSPLSHHRSYTSAFNKRNFPTFLVPFLRTLTNLISIYHSTNQYSRFPTTRLCEEPINSLRMMAAKHLAFVRIVKGWSISRLQC
ncbi:hypothetical protein CDAR_517811 [Caerostris darwini]|uniref:Uncharacterized protein n=1 Tax=Caerostris darwini TaxID=1538125 RepID=A0AAV4UVH4_9ARAC|nr:hypothetical protein CDAR_517811 [Caerostris darwini]